MIIKSIPSTFTIGNLLLGILSIIWTFHHNYHLAAFMIIIAMLLDGLDGYVARALNAQSEFGKQLDSLSDMISFGVAPAFIMYAVTVITINPIWICMVITVFPICGALRLARFNVNSGVPGYFIGLPIPAAGGIACTLALFHESISAIYIIISMIILSCLMVSTIKYPNFKKVRISKKSILIVVTIMILAIVIAIKQPKFIFIPLALYALLGLKKR